MFVSKGDEKLLLTGRNMTCHSTSSLFLIALIDTRCGTRFLGDIMGVVRLAVDANNGCGCQGGRWGCTAL
jgi:hypothetical protein